MRDYQRESYDEICATFNKKIKLPDGQIRKVKNILFRAATGFGKTIITSCIARKSYESGNSILLLVPRITLVHQVLEQFEDTGIPREAIGVIQAPNSNQTYKFRSERPVQIGVIDSIDQNFKEWKKKGLPIARIDRLIIDEAHSTRYAKLWDYYPQAMKLGVTGTPCGQDFRGYYDILIKGKEEVELIAQGYLPDDIYYCFETPDLSDIEGRGKEGELTATQLEEIESRYDAKFKGDLVRHWKERVQDAWGNIPTMIFAGSIQQTQWITEEYAKHDIKCAAIHSKMKQRELDENLRLFVSGEATHLVSVGMAFLGFDLSLYAKKLKLPSISVGCTQIVRPVCSIQMLKQIWGRARGFRTPDGKLRAIHLDHAGCAERLDLYPRMPIAWTLDGNPPAPKKMFKVCPESEKGCGRGDIPIFEKTCPFCGHVFPDLEKVPDTDPKLPGVDKTAIAVELQIEPKTVFETLLEQSKIPSWAFEQFVKFSPTWDECLEAAKVAGYKTPEAFRQWIYGQRIVKNDPKWIPGLEDVLPVLAKLKVIKGESPLNTYKIWVYTCKDAFPGWYLTETQLKEIEKTCEYKSGWAWREAQNFVIPDDDLLIDF